MTEQEDEIRLKELLSVFGEDKQKEIIEILHRDQIRYHNEQLILSGVSNLFASGKKVQIVDCLKGHEFGIGEIVEIVDYFEDDLWLAKGFDDSKWYITQEEANVC